MLRPMEDERVDVQGGYLRHRCLVQHLANLVPAERETVPGLILDHGEITVAIGHFDSVERKLDDRESGNDQASEPNWLRNTCD